MDVDLLHVDWHYATKHILVVDSEFGILLRYEAWLDAVRFALWTTEDVLFNEDLSNDVFTGPADAQLRDIPSMPDLEAFTVELGETVKRAISNRFGQLPPDC